MAEQTVSSWSSEGAIVRSALGRHLFVTDGSRIYDISRDVDPNEDVDSLLLMVDACSPSAVVAGPRFIDGAPLSPPPLQTLSLNVAAACNLGCGYCYADGGSFGRQARLMSVDVAHASVDRLMAEAKPGADVVIGFMGGEPFVARQVVHDTVAYAKRRAADSGRSVRFSVTTNGTLLNDDDIDLLAANSFHVSISIDGQREIHDQLRPNKSGGGSYDAILRNLERMNRRGRPRHLSARATVTPRTDNVPSVIDHLIGLGFDSAGVSPVLVSQRWDDRYDESDFDRLLEGMVEIALTTTSAIFARERYPFSNFETAVHELHRGTHRPYPCGAGAAYLSVSAEGELFACHRFIDDPEMEMGNIVDGSNFGRRAMMLAERHVDRQEPCRSCWARYLCGGGCHHEVLRRGRVACDFIRGWLAHCIGAYAELEARAPLYFTDPERYFSANKSLAGYPSR